jgi:arabinan endo-1,5-alpha-L-arabinosidase
MKTCLVGVAAAIALLLATPSGWSQAPAVQGSSANTAGPSRVRDAERVHDPSTILTWKGQRYCFSTGPGIALMREEEVSGKWLREGRVFAEGKFPAWHAALVPGNRGYLWAPDVIRVGDKLFLYYSVSTFGKNDSAIGLAVSDSLDPASTHWQDHGQVVVSRKSDRFNAIDPAIFRDDDASLWMTFGSFWDGIHLVELDAKTGMRRAPNEPARRLAWSPEIEAPFLCKRGDYYYLFINWGKCCRGTNSTYEIRVGRSRAVTGPYVDRSGIDLRERGGTMVLTSNERWIGPGHASLHEHKGREWLVHHYYDRQAEGRPRLRLVPLAWDAEAWPVVLYD